MSFNLNHHVALTPNRRGETSCACVPRIVTPVAISFVKESEIGDEKHRTCYDVLKAAQVASAGHGCVGKGHMGKKQMPNLMLRSTSELWRREFVPAQHALRSSTVTRDLQEEAQLS